jgi:hypothetical protein
MTSRFCSTITIALCGISLVACGKFSETIEDDTVGVNGSFEVTESGLPVNWLIYSPKTIPEGDYDLIVDTSEFKSGKQSLKFFVRECSSVGGWHSPGLSQQWDAIPGETYTIEFWVMNEGAEFIVNFGAVTEFDGRMETIIRSDEQISNWKRYSYKYTVPSKFKQIRFELNVLKPGSFWVDDVTIKRDANK